MAADRRRRHRDLIRGALASTGITGTDGKPLDFRPHDFRRIFTTDASANTVDVVTGRFPVGIAFTAVTPCDDNGAPATCPGPGFQPNYLGSINPYTGHLTAVPVTGAPLQPKGMIYVGPGSRVS